MRANSPTSGSLLPLLFLLTAACGNAARRPEPGQAPGAVELAAVTPAGGEAMAPDDAGAQDGGGPEGTEPGLVATEPPALLVAPPPVRLTEGGCCVAPSWTADGRSLWFIDKPPPDGPTGIYAIDVDAPLAAPRLVSETVASFSPDGQYRVDRAPGSTRLVRLEDQAAFDIPAGGRAVSFSPDGERIAWTADNPNASLERQVARVQVSRVDGSEIREVGPLPRGSLAGWLDDAHILVRGRENQDSDLDILWAVPVDDPGARREVLRARRMRGTALSPGGAHLAYMIAGTGVPAEDGLWLVGTAAGSPAPARLPGDLFGGYQWRGPDHLLVIPFEPGAPTQRLIEVDVAAGASRPLTDPTITGPWKIANGDWQVAPGGARLVFLSATDKNLWRLDLPAVVVE